MQMPPAQDATQRFLAALGVLPLVNDKWARGGQHVAP